MKFVLFFAGVVLFETITSAFGQTEEYIQCYDELGITEDMVRELNEEKIWKPEFRCLNACVMKKTGELEPGNQLNWNIMYEVALQQFGDKSIEIIRARWECAERMKDFISFMHECEFVRWIYACPARD